MTARIGPRLGAMLSDLGISRSAESEPSAREHWPPGAAASPAKPVAVTLTVERADVDALSAAGLIDPVVHLTSVTGSVLPADVLDIADVPGVLGVERTVVTRPTIHSSVPATKADYFRTSAPGRTGAGVVVGIVDSGIDIFHHAFRTNTGDTRVIALWDMTSPYALTAKDTPTGGTFTLTWDPPGAAQAETTPGLPFNATAAAVQSTLEAFTSIDPGDVKVTGGPLPGTAVVVTFAGRYRRKDVEPITITSSTTPAPSKIAIDRGRKYDFGEINAAVHAAEDQWTSWDADGHGTHVAGIAAGDGSQSGTPQQDSCHGSGYYIGVAPEASLVVVKTTFDSDKNKEGVHWVFDTAGARAAVVNLSLGSEGSAHDGSEDEEREYDALLVANPIGRTIVTTAGNTGALAKVEDKKSPRNGGLHSRKAITASGTATMRFVVPDRDEEDDWLNIWYGGATRLSLQLREPDGAQLTAPVGPDDPTYTTALAGHGMYISNTTVESVTGRHNIAIRISPRANPSPNVAGTVKPGTWTLTLTETAGTGDDVDCWIDRGGKDRCPRFVNADQDRTRTLGSPGTAHNVITVANYNHSTNKIDESSSRGPTIDNRPAGETKPDLAAPGVGIVAAKSSARNTGVLLRLLLRLLRHVEWHVDVGAARDRRRRVAVPGRADPHLGWCAHTGSATVPTRRTRSPGRRCRTPSGERGSSMPRRHC